MIKKTLFIITILLFVGCATISTEKPYNTPFINANETIQLQEGMSKAAVLESVGDPLYIKSGIDNTIIWIYEVRSTEVLSDTDLLTKKITPNKTNANKRHSNPIHRLEIVFFDNKVKRWEMIVKEKKKKLTLPIIKVVVIEKNDILKTKKENQKKNQPTKTSGLIISPSIWALSTMPDRGFGFGVSFLNQRHMGFELNYNSTENEEVLVGEYDAWNYESLGDSITNRIEYSSISALILYQKHIKQMDIQLGVGLSFVSSRENKGDQNSAELFMRMGIGKHFNYKKLDLLPMIEINYFNEGIGFSLMSRINFDL